MDSIGFYKKLDLGNTGGILFIIVNFVDGTSKTSNKYRFQSKRRTGMNGTASIDLATYLLGLIVLLLVFLLMMVRKLVVLLTTLLERREQTILPQTAESDRSLFDGNCTEEELAAITAVLAQLLPDNHRKIVNLKLIQ